MKLLTALLGLLMFSQSAQATTFFGFDFGLVNDQKTITSSNQVSESFYDGNFGVQILNDSSMYLTVGYLYTASVEPLSTTTRATFASNNPYAGIKYNFGKKGLVSLGAYWAPYVLATYTQTAAASEEWSGSGFYGKLMIQPELSPSFQVSMGLGYFNGNYTLKGSAASVSSVTSFSRSVLTPLIGALIKF